MVYHPINHQRHSIRLPEYDYSHSGGYFVTICTQDRRPLLSRIVGDMAHLSPAGNMLQIWYKKLEAKFPRINCDTFIAMPNHVHFIILIRGEDSTPSLPRIVQWFKTMTTNHYIRGVKTLGWPAFKKRLWQRNYYERVIRNEDDLKLAREYILANPINWHKDPYHDPL